MNAIGGGWCKWDYSISSLQRDFSHSLIDRATVDVVHFGRLYSPSGFKRTMSNGSSVRSASRATNMAKPVNKPK